MGRSIFDSEDLTAAPQGDGAVLHGKVPPQKWCVTRADLRQFRKAVRQYVADGKITPTERDKFDVNDDFIGPSVHTVNAQFIRPITKKAGNMSWALMLHPEGLECDLFVTHGWGEGIYEFIDKVLYSWPRGARHAYCCMLSNPQNLDIADLIGSPRDSPFAKALYSSTYMLVVPNRKASIYTRIWCAYEAFLAYSESKLIFTACAPVPNLALYVSGPLLVGVIGFTTAVATVVYDDGTDHGYYYAGVSFGLLFLSSFTEPGHVSRMLVYMGGFSGSWGLGTTLRHWVEKTDPSDHYIYTDVIIGLSFPISAAIAEADRLWRQQASEGATQLDSGYNRKLRNAEAARVSDKEAILKEIVESGVEQEVENAVQVLLDSGMSTPTLRVATGQVGKLRHAGYVNWSMLSLVCLSWLYVVLRSISDHVESFLLDSRWPQWCHPENMAELESSCSTIESWVERCLEDWPKEHLFCASWVEWCSKQWPKRQLWCTPPLEKAAVWYNIIGALEGVIWLIQFIILGSDKKAFAAAMLVKSVMLIAMPLYLLSRLAAEVELRNNTPAQITGFFVLLPLNLLLAYMGPGWTSIIPVVGPRLVRFIMVTYSCRRRATHGKASVGSGGETLPSIHEQC